MSVADWICTYILIALRSTGYKYNNTELGINRGSQFSTVSLQYLHPTIHTSVQPSHTKTDRRSLTRTTRTRTIHVRSASTRSSAIRPRQSNYHASLNTGDGIYFIKKIPLRSKAQVPRKSPPTVPVSALFTHTHLAQ